MPWWAELLIGVFGFWALVASAFLIYVLYAIVHMFDRW